MKTPHRRKWSIRFALAVGLLVAASVAFIAIERRHPPAPAIEKQPTPTVTTAEPPSQPPGSYAPLVPRSSRTVAAAPGATKPLPSIESLTQAQDSAAITVSPDLLQYWKGRLRSAELRGLDDRFRRIAITQPGPEIVSVLDRIQLAKLPNSPNPIAGLVTNLYEALLVVQSFESMCITGPPGACAEYKNTYFISGGRSTSVVTNFEEGYAIKPGVPTIYYWDRKDITP